MIARVNSVANTNVQAKSGIMFRSSSGVDAMMAMVMQRPDNLVGFQWRTIVGASAEWNNLWLGGTDQVKFLRLLRNGDLFAAYYSTHTAQGPWTQIGLARTIVMPDEILVGLAVTAHDDGEVCHTEIDKVSLNNISDPSALVIDGQLFLQGPFNSGTMGIDLNTLGRLPLEQPYDIMPWNYDGPEEVTSIPADVVDWVLLRIYDGLDPSCILQERACFVKDDGSIVDLDGSEGVDLGTIPVKSIHVSVHHRNHLGIRTSAKIDIH